MSKNNCGLIFQTSDGRFAIALHKEQEEIFKRNKKLLIHLYEDRLCTKPLSDRPVLKSIDKLTLIGFND